MSKRNFISVKLIDDSGDEFDSCDNCIHSDDSEEICVMRKCVHAFYELKDCFEKKEQTRKIGYWIHAGNMIPRCPFCDAYSDDADRGIFFGEGKEMVDASYCPNCGARLDFKL